MSDIWVLLGYVSHASGRWAILHSLDDFTYCNADASTTDVVVVILLWKEFTHPQCIHSMFVRFSACVYIF